MMKLLLMMMMMLTVRAEMMKDGDNYSVDCKSETDQTWKYCQWSHPVKN